MRTVLQERDTMLVPRYAEFMTFRGRYAVLYGGAGGGKSWAAAQKVVRWALEWPGARILVVRKVRATMRQSCWMQLWRVIRDYGMEGEATAVLDTLSIKFGNGSEIVCVGVDNPEKLKSIYGFGQVWVEEATELDEADFAQLELRVRGETVGYKQFVLTLNPVDQSSWIYNRFFGVNNGGVDADVFVVHAVAGDNGFLDAGYLRHLDTTVRGDANLYRIYGLGEWGYVRRGGAFYKCFDAGVHVRACAYDPELALHVSFDFNLQPYTTATVWQVAARPHPGPPLHGEELKGGGENVLAFIARQIGEVCLETPRNTTEELCRGVLERYAGHTAGVFVYGDPSGRTSSGLTDGVTHHFTLIKRYLAGWEPVMRVPQAAPGLRQRGLFINAVLAGRQAEIAIEIDPGCVRTVRDYLNVLEDADGSKVKKATVGTTSGVRAQQVGHCSDANDYFLCECFKDVFRVYMRGMKVLPPAAFGERRYY